MSNIDLEGTLVEDEALSGTLSSSINTGEAAWGTITGTLSDQTDLQTALDAKQATISDLSTIRSGAALGATALQEVPNTYRTSAAQDVIDAAKQDTLTAGTGIDITNNVISNDVSPLVPTQATSSNQLADKDFVNSSINSVTAFYITKNATGDQFATKAELLAATTFYSGGAVRVPTRNDYCIVQADETHDSATTRYIYQNSQWEFQYIVNETTLTAAQLATINSGITTSGVSQITTNQQAINTHTADSTIHVTSSDKTTWNGKEDKGKITIGSTEYTVAVSSTDAGTAGYITFVVGA